MTPIPKLIDLYNGIIASIQTRFGIVLSLGKSFFRVLAGVWAGQMKIQYVYLANVQKNIRYTTADYPTLIQDGMIYLQRLPYEATQGNYLCALTGTTAGAVIRANTQFLSDPASLSPGYVFILDNAYTCTGTSDVITLRATVAGTVSNLNIGDTLTCQQPLTNINQVVTVTTISVSAIDSENIEDYRTLIGLQIRLSPQGGSVADYILWASNADGVKRSYPYTASGAPWQVNVFIEAILSDSGGSAPDYNYGIPTSTILTDATNDIIADPITGVARKPLGVILGPSNSGALPAVVDQVAITFTGSTGISAGDQALIKQALREAVANIRPYIPGAPGAPQNDTISIGLPATGGRVTPPEQYIVTVIAINAAPGAVFTGITMTVNGISQTIYTFDNGIIPYLKSSNILFT